MGEQAHGQTKRTEGAWQRYIDRPLVAVRQDGRPASCTRTWQNRLGLCVTGTLMPEFKICRSSKYSTQLILALCSSPRAIVDLAHDPLHPLLEAVPGLGRGCLDEPRAVPDGVEVESLRDLLLGSSNRLRRTGCR